MDTAISTPFVYTFWSLLTHFPVKNGRAEIVLDSTGLKIYGEGEWKVRKHGYSKHRTWRKLHVGANPDNGEIQVVVLTENGISDDAVVKNMLEQIEQTLLSCAADGAYDKRKVYDALNAHSPEVEILIPPRKNAHIWQHGNSKADRLKRDENLRYIRKHGRAQWKEIQATYSFLGRNHHVPTEIRLWGQAGCASAGDKNHAGLHLVLGTQQNDPSWLA